MVNPPPKVVSRPFFLQLALPQREPASYATDFKILHSWAFFIHLFNFFIRSKIYIKREEKYDPWTNFLKPFEKDVWAAIIVYLGLSALVRYFLYRFLHILKEVGLYRCFLLSLQAFCNQGELSFLPSDMFFCLFENVTKNYF